MPTVTSIDPRVANLVSLSAANIPLDLERKVRPEIAAAPTPRDILGGFILLWLLLGRPLEKLQVAMDGRRWCFGMVTIS